MSRQRPPWGILAKLTVFVVISLVLGVVVTSTLLNLRSAPTSAFRAMFTDASGLQAGDSVDVAGVQVGTVTGVRLDGYQALASFTLDKDQSITTTTHVDVDYANLLGQQLLALEPGQTKGDPLPPGALVPIARTAPALDLTSIFNGFQPLFDALTPQQVNQLTASVIDVFQGESGTISGLVSQTVALTENLVQRQQLIGEVVDNLNTVVGTLANHNQQLVTMITQFNRLVTGLAGERGQLGSTIDSVSGLSAAVAGLLTQSQPSLDQAINGLASAGHTIAQDQQGVDATLTGLPNFIKTLDKVSNSVSYLNVYLCNLTINVPGQININNSIPGLPLSFSLPSGPVGDQSQHTVNCR
jgi:phospholipid/cholesterol/gamma-HCH transport system substrate-binding protein